MKRFLIFIPLYHFNCLLHSLSSIGFDDVFTYILFSFNCKANICVKQLLCEHWIMTIDLTKLFFFADHHSTFHLRFCLITKSGSTIIYSSCVLLNQWMFSQMDKFNNVHIGLIVQVVSGWVVHLSLWPLHWSGTWIIFSVSGSGHFLRKPSSWKHLPVMRVLANIWDGWARVALLKAIKT